MTEEDAEDIDLEELAEEQQAPEMTTFEVAATRVFEVDFPENQLRTLMNRTGEETVDEAVAATFLEREKQYVAPHQKLLGADIQANEASDE